MSKIKDSMGLVSSEDSLWLADGNLFTVTLHGFASVYVCILVTSSKRIPVISH